MTSTRTTTVRNHPPRAVSMDSDRPWLDRLQYGDGVEDVADDVGDVLALDLGLGPQDEPVAQDGERDRLHVLVREEVPALEDGPRAGTAEEVKGRPRAGPE